MLELFSERRPPVCREASHDIMDEVLSECNTVEVFYVLELWDDFQIGLQGFDLRCQDFSDLLD